MSFEKVVSEHKAKMEKTVEIFHDNLKSMRTGQASTGLVEGIKVDYYGSPTPLKQLATLVAPQPDSIVIKPFDPGSVQQIEKAIRNSDLSIAPMVEGKMIRLNIPPLSEERRERIIQQLKKNGEQTKVSIRNIRREVNKELEQQEKDSKITEDDLKLGKKQIDDITKEYTVKVDEIIKHKAGEIMGD